MTLEQAIEEMQGFAKETPMFVGSPKAAKIAEWLQELASFKDKTPITNEFLEFIGFKRENMICPYYKGEISIQKMCGGIGDWTWECVYFKGKSWTSDLVDTVFIKTIGELRMFLALCGLGDLANQLKA
jgi:hypothetical protein